MKNFTIIIFLFTVSTSFSQNYQLLPDSCTFCSHSVSTGSNSWNSSFYGITPGNDTVYNGNTYMRISWGNWIGAWGYPFGVRQNGNKLMGAVQDSINELLIMDFDAQTGDTIFNLYSEGFLYNAKVLSKDSILVNSGVYHHFMQMQGIEYLDQGVWNSLTWDFTWNERALCSQNNTGSNFDELGGVLYNIPFFYVISIPFAYPAFCTTDPIYTNPISVLCYNCNLQANSLKESTNETFSISPNPTENKLQVEFELSGTKDIYIFNSTGLLVHKSRTSLNNIVLELMSLSNGLYTIEVHTDRAISRRKFIIQ